MEAQVADQLITGTLDSVSKIRQLGTQRSSSSIWTSRWTLANGRRGGNFVFVNEDSSQKPR